MKVAIYARYSSDNQRDASIADQFRMCRLHAEKQGWHIVEEYSDHAISGASLIRPGIQALMADAMGGRFDLILAEAMDRLSRDQEDIAGIFKRMSYADVKMFTLSEGEVTHLHVGLKGTMNALFLKDLADKTRRGQRGRVEAGKSGGGNAYGYDVVKKFDANGEPIRGDRTINEFQAEVVRRIFRDYAAGKSAKTIAFALNKEGIPAPSGGDWGFSTINGNPKRGNGILNNEMYVGKIVWNRQRFVKDPSTGKRQARPNPEEEWVIQEAPELRILDDDLWSAVKARQEKNKIARKENGEADLSRINTRRRPKYLFSGLTKCSCCGGGYSAISATLIGCATARNKGTCNNRVNIRRDELESRVLNALRTKLVDPELFAHFCEVFTQEMNRLRMEGRAGIASAEAELAKVNRELEKILDLYLSDALSVDMVKERSKKLEARKTELEQFLAEADEPPPLLHPSMALQYRKRVQQLYDALQDEDEGKRIEAADTLRSLVDQIVLTPVDGKVEIDVQGDLAGILTISTQSKNPAAGATGSQVKMVAGAGFEPAAFRL
ncbi:MULTISPECIES: recombinase family protein [Hyphomicrobiales]|uniref:Recombinase family protein n=2 Tax=Brucellaceae TaxID=118882 RepID=A0A316J622_9HYPH|nr:MULTISPECIES: recombinase family protein [Brucella/Ochrobactrum group]ABS15843.1 Recombinase [Brucella anthropi ATCC 49188]PWL16751.1 recombinase family protein [Falsochrobactrum shanghaiense]KAB2742386.1 recombinase family protein [Brucella anthropi]KAB2747364.1 recombinase family protein [Brucella anthropi]KAB2781814.1 recombinase family protein [Brucella anthropi]